MLYYPQIDPIAMSIGPIKIHWYGIMYLFGFACAYGLARYRSQKAGNSWTQEQVIDLIFYAALGVILGGRLGYMLFYNFPAFMENPLQIFKVWDGGMSFHGGFIGVMIALWLFSRKIKKSLWELTDFVAPLVPVGLAAGRIGNFINGELWGRTSNLPWAMVFPNAGALSRHPSQIYEFLLEGICLFIILWTFSSKPRPRFAVSALFLLCYGCFRVFAEFFRQPDPQYGYLAWGWLTMGQILSFPMIITGAICLAWIYFYKDSKNV